MIRGKIFKIQFLINPAGVCHKKSVTEKISEKVLLVAELRPFLYHKVCILYGFVETVFPLWIPLLAWRLTYKFGRY